MRGIFPAALLDGLEKRFLNGAPIGRHFDLITGTSTGGIIAISLGAEVSASDICDLYVRRGREIFPPWKQNRFSKCWNNVRFLYDREALSGVLIETLGSKKFGESVTRLCIPSFEGKYGEPYIFKTPHHPDFRLDAFEPMSKVAIATSAAPTFFQPLSDNGYTFVDGGIWANNPIMVGLIDALSCFDLERGQIRILSLGCGEAPFTVGSTKVWLGGRLSWRHIVNAAMRLQSHNVLGQAGLLIGADRILRVSPSNQIARIELDNWKEAVNSIPQTIEPVLDECGPRIRSEFLSGEVNEYTPLVRCTAE